jgi:prepilin-type N-terminal cleavage/methylation domain-containing protein
MRLISPRLHGSRRAFTLIELLVVISIILILGGLAFPAFQSVQNSARNTQAKNDLVQIVTAVNAFYTEYGRYPSADTSDVTFGTSTKTNDQLLNDLRGTNFAKYNPRDVAFIAPPVAKDASKPKGGLGPNDGRWYDPWGKEYNIRLDTDYDGAVDNPYSANAGYNKVDQGAITWSLGKDGAGGTGDKATGAAKDDVISWQ